MLTLNKRMYDEEESITVVMSYLKLLFIVSLKSTLLRGVRANVIIYYLNDNEIFKCNIVKAYVTEFFYADNIR